TLLGGVRACLELAARARAAGKHAIVSHTLEGTVGFAACHALARALGGGPHGLGAPLRGSPARTPRRAHVQLARPSWDTVRAIHDALAARRPIALLHPKLPPTELARQRAILDG